MEFKEDKEIEKIADYHIEENIEKNCRIGMKDRKIGTRKK